MWHLKKKKSHHSNRNRVEKWLLPGTKEGGPRKRPVEGYKLPIIRRIKSEDLIHSMIIILDKTHIL